MGGEPGEGMKRGGESFSEIRGGNSLGTILPPSPFTNEVSHRRGVERMEREDDDAYHDARAAGAWRIFFESITRLNEEGREDQAAVRTL